MGLDPSVGLSVLLPSVAWGYASPAQGRRTGGLLRTWGGCKPRERRSERWTRHFLVNAGYGLINQVIVGSLSELTPDDMARLARQARELCEAVLSA